MVRRTSSIPIESLPPLLLIILILKRLSDIDYHGPPTLCCSGCCLGCGTHLLTGLPLITVELIVQVRVATATTILFI